MLFYKIKLKSLPKILFAIKVDAEKYCNYFLDRENFLEISLHLKGRVCFKHKNGNIENFNPNEIATILPDFNGITYCENGNTHITVGMEVEYEHNLYDTDNINKSDIRKILSEACEEDVFLLPYRHTSGDKFPFIYNSINEISRHFLRGTIGDLGICKSKLFCLLSKISSVCATELLHIIEIETKDINLTYCEMIKSYIENHYAEKITLDSIANEIGVSKNHLCRIFKATEQCTINEYITNYRLEFAKTMLAASGVSVSEIAQSIGIADEYYLSRLFRSKNGLCIKEYRNMMKKP